MRKVLCTVVLALISLAANAGDRIYVLTGENELLLIDSSRSNAALSSRLISGLSEGELIVSVDFRPANASLYGVSNLDVLYRIDVATGVAVAIAPTPFMPSTSTDDIATDFDPVIDRLRVVDLADHNFRLHPDTGRNVATDGTVAWAPGDSGVGLNPSIAAIANSNNVIGASESTTWVIDADRDVLAMMGVPAGGIGAAFGGLLYTVGALKVDTTVVAGFDIGENGNAWAMLAENGLPKLFSINLETGAAGFVGTLPRTTAIDIAIAPIEKLYVLPVAGRVAGANNTLFRTDVRIVNRSTAHVPVKLEFYATGEAGNNMPSASTSIDVANGEQVILDDLLQSKFGLESGIGAIVVRTGNQLVLASRVYNDQRAVGAGTFGQFVPAFEDTDSRSSGTLPLLSNRPAAELAGYRSNIGWFNLDEGAVRVTFHAISPSGTQLASQTLTVQGLAHQQASLAQLFPTLPVVDDLYVTFKVDGGSLFVYASVVDNVNGDAIFVPPL